MIEKYKVMTLTVGKINQIFYENKILSPLFSVRVPFSKFFVWECTFLTSHGQHDFCFLSIKRKRVKY